MGFIAAESMFPSIWKFRCVPGKGKFVHIA